MGTLDQILTKHRVPGFPNRQIISRQLHGFGDASTLAYGGVVYLRTMYEDTTVTINLVMSKSRVAPSTIQRLELCASLTTSQLLAQVAKDLGIPSKAVYVWTDSAAVLGQLKKSPTVLPVYVANRAVKTIDNVPAHLWRYINTLDNPADILSRGAFSSELEEHELWWKGPPWLKDSPASWPRRPGR